MKELEEIVDTFLNSVAKIKAKYGGNSYYSYVNENNSKGTSCIEPSTIKNHLLYMLRDNHLSYYPRGFRSSHRSQGVPLPPLSWETMPAEG